MDFEATKQIIKKYKPQGEVSKEMVLDCWSTVGKQSMMGVG